MSDSRTLRTPLHALHVELGARMAPFAGYDMPIQYPSGILAEHLHTRAEAGLFDVSHMGQAWLDGPDHATIARALEALCPADILGLAPGRQRYTQFLNAEGGVIDDLMVSRPHDADGRLALVVNAARKAIDFAFLRGVCRPHVQLTLATDRALIALQGPPPRRARAHRAGRGVERCRSWASRPIAIGALRRRSLALRLYRRGRLRDFAARRGGRGLRAALLAETESRRSASARAIRCGWRPGLCLYGHELDEATDPDRGGPRLVDPEAAARRGRLSRRGAHPGGARARARRAAASACGSKGRAPARDGAEIVDADGARSASSPRAVSAPASARRSRWAMSRSAAPRRERRSASSCAASRCRRASRPCPSTPTPIIRG